ncbi:MAG: hypothetical protein IT361_09510 [Gemmatimonadaceae bacterium]|nr:hypothetical protein [Gemmatimonadaceae bacterium]
MTREIARISTRRQMAVGPSRGSNGAGAVELSRIVDRMGGRSEAARLFPDGWVAVVRLDPLRVVWRQPSGEWAGPFPLPEERRKVDRAERLWYLRFQGEDAIEADRGGWPDTYPEMTGTVAASDGRLLIARPYSAGHPEARYLVVRRDGTVDGHLSLAPGERIVAFGRRNVYVLAKDREDVETIRAHRWNPTTR